MNTVKIILLVVGLLAAVVVVFWLVGIIISLLWFLFWIGLIGLLGYAAYRLLFNHSREKPQIADHEPAALAEMKELDHELEEYKRRYVPDEKDR